MIGRLRGDAHRLGFARRLCRLRYPGFFPSNLYLLDALIIGYVGTQLSLGGGVLAHYARREPTLYDYQQQILTHPNYRRATPVDLLVLEHWLLERASRNYQESLSLRSGLERPTSNIPAQSDSASVNGEALAFRQRTL